MIDICPCSGSGAGSASAAANTGDRISATNCTAEYRAGDCAGLCVLLLSYANFVYSYCCNFLHLCIYFQVQIQGQQQGQMLSQVLQVPAGSHQQLQGVTTAQLIQPGELTEEQHQQVWKGVLCSQKLPISPANTPFPHLSCRPS